MKGQFHESVGIVINQDKKSDLFKDFLQARLCYLRILTPAKKRVNGGEIDNERTFIMGTGRLLGNLSG